MPGKRGQRRRTGTGRVVSAARRSRFFDEYIANGQNGTQAAIAVGVSRVGAPGFSSRMLKEHPEELKARLAALAAPHALSAQEVIAQLARMIRLDPRRMYGKDGALLPVSEMPEDVALCLDGVDVEEDVARTDKKDERSVVSSRTSKVKFSKKAAAVDMGMRHFRLYPDAGQGNLDPEEQAARVRARLGDIDAQLARQKRKDK